MLIKTISYDSRIRFWSRRRRRRRTVFSESGRHAAFTPRTYVVVARLESAGFARELKTRVRV